MAVCRRWQLEREPTAWQATVVVLPMRQHSCHIGTTTTIACQVVDSRARYHRVQMATIAERGANAGTARRARDGRRVYPANNQRAYSTRHTAYRVSREGTAPLTHPLAGNSARTGTNPAIGGQLIVLSIFYRFSLKYPRTN